MAAPHTPKMVGRKFGHLTCLASTSKYNGPHRLYLCQCECGSEPILVQGNNLRNDKHTRSCGCITARRPRIA